MVNMTCNYDITIPFTPRHYRYTIASFYALTAANSGGLNSLVLLTIWKTPSLHKPSYFLIASNALADFLVGFFGEILLIIMHIFHSTFDRHRNREWLDVVCKSIILSKGYSYVLCGASISTLGGMAVDRLLAITLKTSYNSNSKVFKFMGLGLLISWGTITFLTCYILIGMTFEKLRSGFILCAVFVAAALCVIITTYSVAYRKLKEAMASRVRPPNASNSTDINLEKYRNTLNTFIIVCVCLLVSYAPFIIASIIMSLTGFEGSPEKIIARVMLLDISEYLVYCTATINPMLYVWRVRDLRSALKQVVKGLLCARTAYNVRRHRVGLAK